MSIEVVFACGHRAQIGINSASTPVCGCGEARIARTKVRPPTFRGACAGPYAETCAVDPALVNVAPAGALPLKPQE